MLRSTSVLFYIFLCTLAIGEVGAASSPGPGCRLKPTKTGTITSIADNQTIRLADGTALHLDGVLAPSTLDTLSETASWPPERRALQALEGLVQGRSAGIALSGHNRDRYGRLSGHVFVGRPESYRWVQAELVARGAVRVDAASLDVGCAKLLLALEDKARRAGAGLWSHAAYRIRDAKRPRRLLRYRSTYQIVEGRVHKVTRVRKRIYINFDKDWRTDFTIGLTARTAPRLGLDDTRLTELQGRRVRVRGWIERRGGPFIYLRAIGQLELLDAPTHGQRPHVPPDTGRHSKAPNRQVVPSGPRPPPSDTGRKQNRPAVSRPGGFEL